ncbi:MAG: putative inorganic carbon transporter subunit DabA, partial [Nitrospira sp.]
QVRPEWGLARNSLFIIGGRRLTYGTDLEGRSFLHSYDYRIDPDGKLLEVIMTAPLIVAEWINLEYYFSTVAPEMFGSGSKVYHNVTGRIGVMSGNMSDLRMGLPRQSLLNGHRPYHEPMRLTAVIEAPRTVVDTIVQRQPLLKQLFTHRWIKLVVLDPVDRASYRMNGGEGWGRMAGELTEMCTEIHTIEA